ncbi:MAG: hypothetical protein P4L87_24510 [Formivibrio sp.]|nr:hypothetical protein [Formivibrio sp.]
MKTMLVITSSKSGRIRRKHVEFKAARHTIIAGNLCHKADLVWAIGRVTSSYSEPDQDDIAAVRAAAAVACPPSDVANSYIKGQCKVKPVCVHHCKRFTA